MLTDVQRYALEMFAESGMSPTAAARRSYMSRHNIIYHLKKVKAETGLDPYNALHLVELLGMVKVRHGEWVQRCDDNCYWYVCSICEQEPPRNNWGHEYHSAYCPSCGAEMGVKNG